ncbi:DUF5807 family protein, partial [Escherichia coli]|uniref:DUF5807 family protein n=1 Tax=Escherichia coli TaxID=562 RepID=UPI001BE3E8EB
SVSAFIRPVSIAGDVRCGVACGVAETAAASVDRSAFIRRVAFAEAQNEEVGGIYAEGDVIHAYAKSSEGAAFSDRWVVDDG